MDLSSIYLFHQFCNFYCVASLQLHQASTFLFSGNHIRDLRLPLGDTGHGCLAFSRFSYPVIIIIIIIILLCLSTSIHNADLIATEARKRRVMEFLKLEYTLSVNISRRSAVV